METLSSARMDKSNIQSRKAIAQIAYTNSGPLIKYTRDVFARRYIIDKEKLFVRRTDFFNEKSGLNGNRSDQKNYQIHLLLCKLRHITTRNEIIHRILSGILEYQKEYFIYRSHHELKPLTQTDFTDWIKIDFSWLSRSIKGKSIITPQGREAPIKFFFYKKKELKKQLIKKILDTERAELKSGEIKQPYTDSQIKNSLKCH